MNCTYSLVTGLLLVILIFPVISQGENISIPSKADSLENATPSPSGKYVLHLVIENKKQPATLSFSITDKSGDLVYTSTDTFDTRYMVFFLWDKDDRVWMSSAKYGTFFWEKQKDGWKKFSHTDSGVVPPPLLEEKHPRRHKK